MRLSLSRRAVFGLAGIAAIVIFLVSAAPTPLRSIDVDGGFFTGRISGVGEVHLGFWLADDGMEGSMAEDHSDRPQQLAGTRLSDGEYRLTMRSWGATNWVTNAVLVFSLVNAGRELEGQWKSMAGATTRFRLERCARAKEARDSFRMRLGRYGHSRNFACPFPGFDDNYRLFTGVIEGVLRQQHDEFMEDTWSEVWQGIRWPSLCEAWQY